MMQQQQIELRYGAAIFVSALALMLLWPELFNNLFTSTGFMPHGGCYLWKPSLVGLHLTADLLIGSAYVSISATLAYLVYKARASIPFQWVFIAFGLFIVACGTTHFMEVWTLWVPTYWLAGDIKLITAVASVTTALALPPLVPKALQLIENATISEERRKQLEIAHKELAELYNKQKELDQLKTQFFSNVSHELRTPLTLILGPTQKLLGSNPLSKELRDSLEVIDRNARTLLKHVNDLLDVAKLEAGAMDMHYSQVDLSQLVRLTAAYFEGLAAERQFTFAIDADPSISAVVDSDKVQQICFNLLSNAFKFTPDGGEIRIALHTENNPQGQSQQATLTISDNGPGIPAELRQAIFERFRQVDSSSTRQVGGTGLGLAIVKDFVTMHGGSITVTDSPLGGACFLVQLPLAPTNADLASTPTQPEAELQNDNLAQQVLAELQPRLNLIHSHADSQQPLVLVVEDNPDMRQFITDMLVSDYRVVAVSDGQAGLEQAIALQPDLILSDIMMPLLSGDQFVQAVQTHPNLSGIPILIATAKTDDSLRVKLLTSGAQDYLMKPFLAEELKARVNNLVIMKRAREVLQQELADQGKNLMVLAQEAANRKRDLEMALNTLEMRANELAATTKTLEIRNQELDQFAYVASHDLKAPLRAIANLSQWLEEDLSDKLTEDTQHQMNLLRGRVHRLEALIDGLLQYSRIGRVNAPVADVSVADLLAEVIDSISPPSNFHIEIAPDLPILKTAKLRLEQVFTNLLSNAIKHHQGPTGHIQISAREQGEFYEFSVSDDGPGIAPEYHEKVFVIFQTLQARDKAENTGIGLSLVKKIVENQGGTITLESAPNQGSTFRFTWPKQPLTDRP